MHPSSLPGDQDTSGQVWTLLVETAECLVARCQGRKEPVGRLKRVCRKA